MIAILILKRIIKYKSKSDGRENNAVAHNILLDTQWMIIN